ncbi:MAG: TIM barrel protein [Kiritimatiellae bacterium]|nr:TIM barrel protein [Kiritimatiellia bacterium]
MKYSACIEMLFQEVPFLERIAKAKEAGFSHVEFWCWWEKDLPAVKQKLAETGMQVAVFQGNREGTMIDPCDQQKYVDGVLKSMEAAKELGAKALFCLTDVLGPDRTVVPPPHPIAEAQKEGAILEVMAKLAPEAEQAGVTLLMEPLNTLVDHAGYHIHHSQIAWDLHAKIDHPNVKVLYDIYHMQIMEGNIIQTLRRNFDAIGHIHVADVPGRNEPGSGEINYGNIAKVLKNLNYDGIVGFEYEPTGATGESLKQAKAWFEF